MTSPFVLLYLRPHASATRILSYYVFALLTCTLSGIRLELGSDGDESKPQDQSQPWYVDTSSQNRKPLLTGDQDRELLVEPLMAGSIFRKDGSRKNKGKCERECLTTEDCGSSAKSCFLASTTRMGCCLKVLKPNETGCILDDQCRRACDTSFCDHSQTPSRCMCHSDRHFLFNKCWSHCPEFAYPEPVDRDGVSHCVLRVNEKSAQEYMRRMRRQMRSPYC
ncbi:hypothetical protein DdX_20247 [Ditylenchus destructor]|uniref:Uncharacterized protein n=1 Tax=Ditylenchus destructor TaxID=166010 RepID=A0AAD4MHI7_9BILA|nr:hypothetical protein DdX_20247 [Ditylenchus destructor]